jgi:hypothetical protein
MRGLFKLLMGEGFNLPLLGDAYDIADDEFLEIGMDSDSLEYYIVYPSGLSREFERPEGLHSEMKRFVNNDERIEEMIRFATNWRRSVLFPSLGQQFMRFPDGRINFGGLGNHALFLPPVLMKLHNKYNLNPEAHK